MKRATPLLVVLLMVGCGGSAQKSGPAKAPPKDPRMVVIEERIAKTAPDGKQMIEKVKAMKPEVNGQVSGKALGGKADSFAKDNGAYNIIPIGWEASQKKSGRWRVAFNYQDWQKNYLVAEWEYNPETTKLYPFEEHNAPTFWDPPEAPAKGKGKK